MYEVDCTRSAHVLFVDLNKLHVSTHVFVYRSTQIIGYLESVRRCGQRGEERGAQQRGGQAMATVAAATEPLGLYIYILYMTILYIYIYIHIPAGRGPCCGPMR